MGNIKFKHFRDKDFRNDSNLANPLTLSRGILLVNIDYIPTHDGALNLKETLKIMQVMESFDTP